MDLKLLLAYRRDLQPLVEGTPPWRVEPALHELFEKKQWDLLSLLLLSVAEPTARQIINRLLEERVYEPLAVAACLRRHIRTQPFVYKTGGPSVAKRIFRDLEAPDEEEAAGVPDHIMEELKEMAELAERTREAQLMRSESMDRGPMREFIINRLAERLHEQAALEAMMVIAQAAAFEETRRMAAMKVCNNQQAVRRLLEAGRTDELAIVAQETGLGSVAQRIAQMLGERLDELVQKGDREALQLVAEHHPDAGVKEKARQQLEAMGERGAEGQQG